MGFGILSLIENLLGYYQALNMSWLWLKWLKDNADIISLVFQALEIVCFGFLVIGVNRKNRRLTTPALVFYPIKSIYEIPKNLYFILYVLSKFIDRSYTSYRYIIVVIATNLLSIIWMGLVWTTVILYRKQLKEQNSDRSRMVVCSGENFYVNQADSLL